MTTFLSDPILFKPFPKIPRLNREVIVTEKIDGTNASITIVTGAPGAVNMANRTAMVCGEDGIIYDIFAASRSRFITPGNDNFGFAKWVYNYASELVKLGVGTHFGEWWGSGIQRGYGLPNGERRFSLFNVSRWVDCRLQSLEDGQAHAPACCHVVPLIATGMFQYAPEAALEELRHHGSFASPFMNPEGVMVFHTAAQQYFKVTLDGDEKGKG